ncbi:MAG: hypothetical protein WC476_01240 [Phycisphaerae bacterium]|jgi:hypothetical protein
MAYDNRTFEERVYKVGTKECKYQVYFSKRMSRKKPAIELNEVEKLSDFAGLKNWTIKWINAYEDFMFYSSDNQRKEFGEKYPRGMRFICCAGVQDKDGNLFEAIGSASPDSVDLLKNYTPELAEKRAKVRVALDALGLHDLNAGIEFSDTDSPNNSDDSKQTEQVEQDYDEREKLFDEMSKLKLELGWDNDTFKRFLAEIELGKNPVKMSIEELTQVLTAMQKMVKKAKTKGKK